jgi:hypothetical protein
MTWYIPGIIADHRPTLILLGVVIGFIAGLNPKDSWQSMKVRLRQISPIVLFVVVYITFLVISSTTAAYDQIGDRLLSPIYVPLTLFLLILAQILIEQYRRYFSNKVMNTFLLITLVIWLVYPIRSITITAVNLAKIGQGYSSKAWEESNTIKYLLQHQTLESECTIYTNAPDAVYILAHLVTKMIPAKKFYNSQKVMYDISWLKNVWLVDNNKKCIIIFYKVNREYLFAIDELQTVASINLIAHFDDGAIYSIAKK